jgi:hypothetical protein
MVKRAFSIRLIVLSGLGSPRARPAGGFVERLLPELERKLQPIDPAYGPEVRASGLASLGLGFRYRAHLTPSTGRDDSGSNVRAPAAPATVRCAESSW